MTRIKELKHIDGRNDILGGIDITGNFARLFKNPQQMPGCVFLLCTRGDCEIRVHVDKCRMKKNSLVVIFPGVFFQLVRHSKDCRFVFLAFSSDLINSSKLFMFTIEFTPLIFERPVLELPVKAAKLMEDYFMLFIRSHQLAPNMFDREQASLAYTQLILGVGQIFKGKYKKRRHRRQRIMKTLIRDIINEFREERTMQYYADKIHLTAQYTGTALRRMTGKTFTEIIANLVIHDAKAKLSSTELTILEISESLNFSDVSGFGRYFKRYTGMTPTQYRQTAH